MSQRHQPLRSRLNRKSQLFWHRLADEVSSMGARLAYQIIFPYQSARLLGSTNASFGASKIIGSLWIVRFRISKSTHASERSPRFLCPNQGLFDRSFPSPDRIKLDVLDSYLPYSPNVPKYWCSQASPSSSVLHQSSVLGANHHHHIYIPYAYAYAHMPHKRTAQNVSTSSSRKSHKSETRRTSGSLRTSSNEEANVGSMELATALERDRASSDLTSKFTTASSHRCITCGTILMTGGF